MPALITTLIDKRDTSELVRDQIAAILVVESAAQMVLATAALKDPLQWKLRVYLERANPWAEFQNALDPDLDVSPVVSVTFDNATYDMGSSNVVERQKASGTFYIDCLGFGRSTEEATGHEPGDELASLEAQRAARLVRNILMAGHYTYLGMRGTVWRRWPQALNIFKPAIDNRHVQHVVGARLTLQVDFNELSPQVQGEPIELISAQVHRQSDGKLLLRADYPTNP